MLQGGLFWLRRSLGSMPLFCFVLIGKNDKDIRQAAVLACLKVGSLGQSWRGGGIQLWCMHTSSATAACFVVTPAH